MVASSGRWRLHFHSPLTLLAVVAAWSRLARIVPADRDTIGLAARAGTRSATADVLAPEALLAQHQADQAGDAAKKAASFDARAMEIAAGGQTRAATADEAKDAQQRTGEQGQGNAEGEQQWLGDVVEGAQAAMKFVSKTAKLASGAATPCTNFCVTCADKRRLLLSRGHGWKAQFNDMLESLLDEVDAASPQGDFSKGTEPEVSEPFTDLGLPEDAFESLQQLGSKEAGMSPADFTEKFKELEKEGKDFPKEHVAAQMMSAILSKSFASLGIEELEEPCQDLTIMVYKDDSQGQEEYDKENDDFIKPFFKSLDKLYDLDKNKSGIKEAPECKKDVMKGVKIEGMPAIRPKDCVPSEIFDLLQSSDRFCGGKGVGGVKSIYEGDIGKEADHEEMCRDGITPVEHTEKKKKAEEEAKKSSWLPSFSNPLSAGTDAVKEHLAKLNPFSGGNPLEAAKNKLASLNPFSGASSWFGGKAANATNAVTDAANGAAKGVTDAASGAAKEVSNAANEAADAANGAAKTSSSWFSGFR